MCVYMRSGGYGTGSMQYQRWYWLRMYIATNFHIAWGGLVMTTTSIQFISNALWLIGFSGLMWVTLLSLFGQACDCYTLYTRTLF